MHNSTHDMAQLKYLECCIKDTLRIYPSIPYVLRTLTEGLEIGTTAEINFNLNKIILLDESTEGHMLLSGVKISIHIYAIHQSSLIYLDPEVFNPERFFPENSVGRHPCAFIPLSAGPRNCIGESLQIQIIKYAVVK